MKILILLLTILTIPAASAAWRQWMECVTIETVNGVESRMDPNPSIDFGYVGHGTLAIKGEKSSVTAEISGADSNIMITAHDQVTGVDIVSHSMGVGAVAILKFNQGGRKLEISCYVDKQN
jgi:hypothetical protein